MKREKIKELMNELIEREFTIDEMAELFGEVRDYLNEKKAAEMEYEDETERQVHARSLPLYRKWLQDTLNSLGITYTIEDFEEDF